MFKIIENIVKIWYNNSIVYYIGEESMKIKLILILLCCLFLFTGCKRKLQSYNSLTEYEMIKYVKDVIYKDIGEEVNVEIKSKWQNEVCDALIDGSCFGAHKVPDTFRYNLIITSKNNPKISAEGNYFTDSYKEDNIIIEREFDYENYKKKYAYDLFKSEIDEILQNFKYYREGTDVFIFSKDYNYLHQELFSYILNVGYIYYDNQPIIKYNIYVIKDEEVFNYLTETDFDYYNVTKDAKNVRNTYGYARNFMEIESTEGYKYTFFGYSSNGCIGCINGCSCSIVYGINL